MALSDYMKSILDAMKDDSNQSNSESDNGSDNNQNGNSEQSGSTGKAGAAAGNAFGKGQMSDKGSFDTHIDGKGDYKPLDDTKTRDSEITDKDIRDAIKDALNVGNINKKDIIGNGAGNFNKTIADKKLRTTQPWKTIMRQMVQRIQYKRSFSRINYRMAAARVTSPAITQSKQHSDIIFAVDVSGSMSDQTLDTIMNEVLSLSRQTNIKNMRILTWDGAVTKDIFVQNGRMLDKEKGFFNFAGGGGTSIDCVYNYIIDKNYNPSGVCYFTDGLVEGDKFYTGKRNDCENAVLITKYGTTEVMEKIKKEKHYTHLTIYQTDL